MCKIFISYRRADTEFPAAHLCADLERVYGRDPVFRDVDSVPAGARFDEIIQQQLSRSHVVLALIGEAWLPELHRRMKSGMKDYLREELATAIERGMRIIPVLVQGAKLPDATLLPKDLQPLASFQALELRQGDWRDHVKRIIEAVGLPRRFRWLLVRVLVAALAIVVGVKWLLPLLAPEERRNYALAKLLVGTLILAYVLADAALFFWRRCRRGDGTRHGAQPEIRDSSFRA